MEGFNTEYNSSEYCRLFLMSALSLLKFKHNKFDEENITFGIRWAEDILFESYRYCASWNNWNYERKGKFDFTNGELKGRIFDTICDVIESFIFGDNNIQVNRANELTEREIDSVISLYNGIIDYINKRFPIDALNSAIEEYNSLVSSHGMINRYEASDEEKREYVENLANQFCKIQLKDNIFTNYLVNYYDDVHSILGRSYFRDIFELEAAMRDYTKNSKDPETIYNVAIALNGLACLHPYSEDYSIHFCHDLKSFKKKYQPYFLWKIEAIKNGSRHYFRYYEIEDLIELGANDVIDFLLEKAIEQQNISAIYDLNEKNNVEERIVDTKLWHCIKLLKCFDFFNGDLDDAKKYIDYVKTNCSLEEKQEIVQKAYDIHPHTEKTNVKDYLLGNASEFKYEKGKVIKSDEMFKKSGCYIATCVYGSYDCPEVWTLRRFRDYKLNKTWYGRLFIKTYYAISPKLVKLFGKTKWFKKLWKKKLDKMVSKCNEQGFLDTPYDDMY